MARANAAAITTINRKFVQNALLQLLPNKRLKKFPPTPVAQNTAITTAIPKIIIKNIFKDLLTINPSLSPISYV